jgi:molybdopterin converting factor small subunit
MPKIEIGYYGRYAEITGKTSELLDLDDATLVALIDQVRKKYGAKLDEVIWDRQKNTLRGGVSVLVNGRSLPLDTRLKNSDQVAFLMLMAGG